MSDTSPDEGEDRCKKLTLSLSMRVLVNRRSRDSSLNFSSQRRTTSITAEAQGNVFGFWSSTSTAPAGVMFPHGVLN
jgi:hypothetical protein